MAVFSIRGTFSIRRKGLVRWALFVCYSNYLSLGKWGIKWDDSWFINIVTYQLLTRAHFSYGPLTSSHLA